MTKLATRFVTIALLTIAIVQLWSLAVFAAEPTTKYLVPGSCVKVFTQEVRRDGSTALRIQTLCEYTPEQRARLARTGR